MTNCKTQSELVTWMEDLETDYAKPNETWGETADRIEEEEPDVAETFRRAETLWFNLDN